MDPYMPTVKIIMLLLASMVLGACTSDAQIEPKKVNIEQLQHNWELTHIDNIKLATVIHSSLKIEADNKATGSLGCNLFFGQVEFTNNQLRIGKMGNTRKMCSDIENNVEMDVSQVLNRWGNVMIDDKTLIISNQKHSLTYKLIEKTAK